MDRPLFRPARILAVLAWLAVISAAVWASIEPQPPLVALFDGAKPQIQRNPRWIEVGPPTRHISAPLYDALIDTEKRMPLVVWFTVRGEDCGNGEQPDRNYYTPPELRDVALEDDDYAESEFDRGHSRSKQLSGGSQHWRCINNVAIMWPEARKLNQQTISRLESQIAAKAQGVGRVDVRIVALWDKQMPPLPKADEPHQVPSGFRYEVTVCGETEFYQFPNSEDVNPDPETYRLK